MLTKTSSDHRHPARRFDRRTMLIFRLAFLACLGPPASHAADVGSFADKATGLRHPDTAIAVDDAGGGFSGLDVKLPDEFEVLNDEVAPTLKWDETATACFRPIGGEGTFYDIDAASCKLQCSQNDACTGASYSPNWNGKRTCFLAATVDNPTLKIPCDSKSKWTAYKKRIAIEEDPSAEPNVNPGLPESSVNPSADEDNNSLTTTLPSVNPSAEPSVNPSTQPSVTPGSIGAHVTITAGWKHPTDDSVVGTYFSFDQSEWTSVFGGAATSDSIFHGVEQWRDNRKIWTGNVKVWPPNDTVPYSFFGRKDPIEGPLFQTGDQLVRVPSQMTSGDHVTIIADWDRGRRKPPGLYFSFDLSGWTSVFGKAPGGYGSKHWVELWRNGRKIRKEYIRVWPPNGVNRFSCVGRRNSRPKGGQFQTGDQLVPVGKDTDDNSATQDDSDVALLS